MSEETDLYIVKVDVENTFGKTERRITYITINEQEHNMDDRNRYDDTEYDIYKAAHFTVPELEIFLRNMAMHYPAQIMDMQVLESPLGMAIDEMEEL